MRHVLVFETANDVGYGVRFPDIGEKLITQTFPLRSPFDEARNVNKLHAGWDDFLG